MNKRSIQTLFLLFLLLLTTSLVLAQSEEGQLRNPLNYGGPDPWLVYYEGNYYLAATTWTSELTMRKSPTLAGLKTATPIRIYSETDPSRCCNMWAPEFDLLQGDDGLHWYFYYTAGTQDTLDNQHSHVLESAGTDPMGPYTYKGRLFDPSNDTWSIDGSVMQLDGKLYFLNSAFQNGLQSLFIAPMSNPWTIGGTRHLLSQPEFPWEQQGGVVNEGPVALQHNGDTFIIYSASSCNTPDYKLGMLRYNGGDPLSRDSWDKHPDPVFQRSDENGVYGPAHNGFFMSPDGKENWIVYHANDKVTEGCDTERTTRVQKFTWNDDGTPNFGIPVSTAEEIAAPSGDMGIDPLPELPERVLTRFESAGLTGAYLRHTNALIRLDYDVNPLGDSQFIVHPGLVDPTAISLESVNWPGNYLVHQNNVLTLSASDDSDAFKADATWWLRPGLADESLVSFESYSQPGSYIGKRIGVIALVKLTDMKTDVMKEDATFRESH